MTEQKKDNWFITCSLCHLSIDTNEEFAEFIHYKKRGETKSSAFYHVKCFRDKINVSLKANEELSKASRILDKATKALGM